MAKPSVHSMMKMKRLARYLLKHPRATIRFDAVEHREGRIDVCSDSDGAGCRVTGKSTSGGVAMIGAHLIKSWATTQASIALSSAEAELVAMTKATAELLGFLHMVRDLGQQMNGGGASGFVSGVGYRRPEGQRQTSSHQHPHVVDPGEGVPR